MRIDKWLWVARFYKTRRLAQEAILKGRVLLNQSKPKPSRLLSINDDLEIEKESGLFKIKVLAFMETRGAYAVAKTLYYEDECSILEREKIQQDQKLAAAPKPLKSPDSKDRKLLRKIKQGT